MRGKRKRISLRSIGRGITNAYKKAKESAKKLKLKHTLPKWLTEEVNAQTLMSLYSIRTQVQVFKGFKTTSKFWATDISTKKRHKVIVHPALVNKPHELTAKPLTIDFFFYAKMKDWEPPLGRIRLSLGGLAPHESLKSVLVSEIVRILPREKGSLTETGDIRLRSEFLFWHQTCLGFLERQLRKLGVNHIIISADAMKNFSHPEALGYEPRAANIYFPSLEFKTKSGAFWIKDLRKKIRS